MKKLYYSVLIISLLTIRANVSEAQTSLVLNGPASATAANNNTLVGLQAGSQIRTDNSNPSSPFGANNVFVGKQAGAVNSTGYQNTFIGTTAGQRNTTANYNVFVGMDAGGLTTTGGANAFLGNSAGGRNTTGNANSFFGYQAGATNSTAIDGTFMGLNAGLFNLTGNANTYIGKEAGSYNITGSRNTVLGSFAGLYSKNGDGNVLIGSSAGRGVYGPNDDGTGFYGKPLGSFNVMMGDSAGLNQRTTDGNVLVGSKAGYLNQTGQKSTFVGYQSGYNAVADSNTFVGYQSGYTTTTGKGNTFFGTAAGRGNSTGSHNTFVGNGAGPAGSNTDDNVYIGYNTGQRDTGSRNTFLGAQAGVLLADNSQPLTNATAIGAGALVASSNAVILGNQANVGIGTSAPTDRLHLSSGRPDESGLRLADLTANSPATLTMTEKVLTVDATGRVVLTQKGRFPVRSVADWSDTVFTPAYPLRSLRVVEGYIRQHGHLPGVLSAEEVVKQGVDAAKMDAKLLEKIEELTLYSIQLEKAEQQQQQVINRRQQAEIDELKRIVTQLANGK